MTPEGRGSQSYNGVPAGDLPGARWRKSGRSSAQGNCVELDAFLAGVKDGDFDDLAR